MSRSRKNCSCGSEKHDIIDPCDNSKSKEFGRGGSAIFPMDIKGLLISLSENEDDDARRATLILDACANHCLIEDVEIIAVMCNTVVVRDCEKFRFVCIGCICEVVVECQALVEGIFDGRSFNRR